MNARSQSSVAQSQFVEVSLDNLLHNVTTINDMLPSGVAIMAVVKDNAYGCGSVMISRFLEQRGIGFFAVARAHEARILRQAGIRSPILVLGAADIESLRWGATTDIRFSLNDISDLALLKSSDCMVRLHINIDTGMGRLGIQPSEITACAEAMRGESSLQIEGMYTHLANSDAETSHQTDRQLTLFRGIRRSMESSGIHPSVIHFGNSAALMRYPMKECTMVRPGIALYGCKPDPFQDFPLDLKPVLALKSCIVKLKRVGPGFAISYGSTYVTSSETVIATIALGYGQGLPRYLSNKGKVLIRGKYYSIAGRVTMDYIMVDAGARCDLSVGDEVCAMGCQLGECISPDDIARIGSTIGYEVMCSINPTLDRYFIHQGATVLYQPGRPF